MSLTPMEIRQRAEEAKADDAKWRDAARDDFKMYLGDQWNATAKKKLEDAGRPALTINLLRPNTDIVTNTQIANRFTARFLPKEGGDESGAEIVNTISHHIDDNNYAKHVESRVISDGNVCGRGWEMYALDFTNDMLGEIRKYHKDPLSVIPEPSFKEPSLSDCEFVICEDWLSLGRMRAVFGSKADEVAAIYPEPKGVPGEDAIYTEADIALRWKKYPVLGHWHRDYAKRWYVVNRRTGEMYEVGDEETARMLVRKAHRLGLEHYFHAGKVAAKMKVKTVCGDITLSEGDGPFGGELYPFVGYFASWSGGVHQGVVRIGKDAQMELNKRESESLAQASTSQNSLWLLLKGVLDANLLEEKAGQPGAVFEIDPGGTMLPLDQLIRRLDPAMPSMHLLRLVETAKQNLRDTTGILPEILGAGSSGESGRAIALRLQQQTKLLGQYVHNYRLTVEVEARVKLAAIQNHYTFEKTFRILGTGEQGPREITINQIAQDPRFPGVYQVLNNVTLGKYDVVISEQADSPSQRMANLSYVIESMRDLSKFAAMPPLLMAVFEMMPIPASDKARIGKALQESMRMAGQQQGNSPQGGPAGLPGGAPP